MIKTTRDVIAEAIEIKLKEQGTDRENFNRDIYAFNETATKVMVILDSGDCTDRVFVMIGLHATVDRSWKVTYYKHSGETAGAGCFDGIDAMCDADGWLNY